MLMLSVVFDIALSPSRQRNYSDRVRTYLDSLIDTTDRCRPTRSS